MKNLNIALIWTNWDFQNTLIFNLIKKISKRKIVITPPHKADFIIYSSIGLIYALKKFLDTNYNVEKL